MKHPLIYGWALNQLCYNFVQIFVGFIQQLLLIRKANLEKEVLKEKLGIELTKDGAKDKFHKVKDTDNAAEGGSGEEEEDHWDAREHDDKENFDHMVGIISDKTEVGFNEDMVTITLCMYLKKNDGDDKYMLTPRARAK
jgi:hypothetical protein